ncbi:putative ankyrin repeat-containing domain-containing protein [Helianthus annuus]|nr:putative ankyrin repeat-containing domain-containing protein [Helianthus annuus]
MGNNYLVEKLLEFLKDPEVIEKKNLNGFTTLHVAALVDNTVAAQLLVQKREELLEIPDKNEDTPLVIALDIGRLSTSAYLLRCAPPSDSSTYSDYYQHSSIIAAIHTKQYDLAETLLNESSDYAANAFQKVWHKTFMGVSLLFHSNFLDRCVDDILPVAKIFNNTCCNWLGKNSMILLGDISILL